MRDYVEGLNGVEVIADDFLIVGIGNTRWVASWPWPRSSCILDLGPLSWEKPLNKNKAGLRQLEVPFIGHILTPQGLKPDPRKVNAIVNMPDPTDAQSLRRFLGMVNYLAKFVPRLWEETEVLRKLKEKDAQWCWLPAHADAVARVKDMIIMMQRILWSFSVMPLQVDLAQHFYKKGAS